MNVSTIGRGASAYEAQTAHRPDRVAPHIHPDRPLDPAVRAFERERNPLKRTLGVLGPGFITGASDDDPSGIGTYAQAGAQFGYATLWTTVAMLPLMAAIQLICARIGLVTGRGLAGVLRARYPRVVVYPAVMAMMVANTVNVGADLGAVAAALGLLVPVPAPLFVVPVALGILMMQLRGSYERINRIFKWLTLALLAYAGAALFSRPDMGGVLRGSLLPTLQPAPGYLAMLVALLGTTISPYLFFWQASQEIEAEIHQGRRKLWQRQGASGPELRYALWDTLAGMVFSEVVAYFIILATGATLFEHGQRTIVSAIEAAQALRPIAGEASAALLGVGLIGSGVLAIPVLSGSAAYAAAEMFGWRSGLDRRPTRAPQFYAVIVVATVVGVLLDFVGINPIDALVATAILNGLVAPPLLTLVMLASNDRQVMGVRTNGRCLNALGWTTTLLMAAAALTLVVTTIRG